MSEPPRRIGLAITGASGSPYGLRVLRALLETPGIQVHLTLSEPASQVLRLEHGLKVDLRRFDVGQLGLEDPERRLRFYPPDQIAAPMASGSFRLEALAIVPCSMATVARIAQGISANLIDRAADVQLKEQRKLVLVPRETPLSAIHLENLLKLARMGTLILPAMPGFYGRPTSVDELVDFVAARVLDHLNVPHNLGPRWGEKRTSSEDAI
jgi:4-hydroxy-3-polyprenylbenzoate decarboxylase